jgi:hypothetical protein
MQWFTSVIPATLQAEIRRILEASPDKKLARLPRLTNKPGWWLKHVISAMWEAVGRRIAV